MKTTHLIILGSVLVLSLPAALGAEAVAKPAPAPTPAPTPDSAVEAPIPLSVFSVPANSKQGRNPFFPQSAPVVSKTVKPNVVDTSEIVLNGITSPPRRMAMINGKTFEAGEGGEIKLPSGMRLSVQCLEIRDDAVIITVADQRRELRLRAGL